MEYLVISDIHENFHNLQIILNFAIDQKISHGFALGDYNNPGIIWNIGRSGISFDAVLGNNDGEVFGIMNATKEFPNIRMNDIYVECEYDRKKIFVTHDNKIGELVAKSGEYDVVFCGHNHVFTAEIFERGEKKTLLANPGEVSGHMFGISTFGIWNSERNIFTGMKLDGNWIDVKGWKRGITDITVGTGISEFKHTSD